MKNFTEISDDVFVSKFKKCIKSIIKKLTLIIIIIFDK